MRSSSFSTRLGASLCVIGATLVFAGLFFPLFGGRLPTEWQLLVGLAWLHPTLFQLAELLVLALPLVSAIIVPGLSVATFFCPLSPGRIILKRVIAVEGFLCQLLSAVIGRLFAYTPAPSPGAGQVILLIGSITLLVGAFLGRTFNPHPFPLQSPTRPSRLWVMLSMVGSVLALLGFIFFPQLIVNEQPVTILQGIAFIRITSWSDVFMLALLAVPLITVFFILGTGITACFRQLSPASIIWRRVAALTGGILQGLLELLCAIQHHSAHSISFWLFHRPHWLQWHDSWHRF